MTRSYGGGASTYAKRTEARGCASGARAESRRWSDVKLLRRFLETRDIDLRHELVLRNQSLVYMLAKQFANRGEPVDDLVQVGNIGLINAIERYDPSKGVALATYASATIVGEIQRYFRDKCWRIKVPRNVLERYVSIICHKEQLSNKLGRSPTVHEVAAAQGISTEAVLEAMEMGQGYRPRSLDECTGPEGDCTVADGLGCEDERVQSLISFDPLYTALARLTERERTVLEKYYGEELSQAEIAKRVGVSQMQISRIHKKALHVVAEYLRSSEEGVDAVKVRS